MVIPDGVTERVRNFLKCKSTQYVSNCGCFFLNNLVVKTIHVQYLSKIFSRGLTFA